MYVWGANIPSTVNVLANKNGCSRYIPVLYIFLDCKQQVDHHQTDLHIHINIKPRKNIVYDFTATTTAVALAAAAAPIFTENPTPVNRKKYNNRKKWTYKMTTPEFRHIDSRVHWLLMLLLLLWFFCVSLVYIDYFIRPSVRPFARSLIQY